MLHSTVSVLIHARVPNFISDQRARCWKRIKFTKENLMQRWETKSSVEEAGLLDSEFDNLLERDTASLQRSSS